MNAFSNKINLRNFILNIILPVVLTIGAFLFLIFIIVIPYFKTSLIEQKQLILKELVTTALGTVSAYDKEAMVGKISMDSAKRKALLSIAGLRYGKESKDYFWIMDTDQKMIMHPYRPDLNGTQLNNIIDPTGKHIFTEMVEIVQKGGSGYIDYHWQLLADSTKVIPKLSYVSEYKPWKWIIGTGIYLEDVEAEINTIEQRLILISALIICIIGALLLWIVRKDYRNEILRNAAEEEVKAQREKYRLVVEASKEGSALIVNHQCRFANDLFSDLTGIVTENTMSKGITGLIVKHDIRAIELIEQFLSGSEKDFSIETEITGNNKKVHWVLLSLSKVIFNGEKGIIVTLKNLSVLSQSTKFSHTVTEINDDLTNALKQGLFTGQFSKTLQITYANEFFLSMVGLKSNTELRTYDFLSQIIKDEERNSFTDAMRTEMIIDNFLVQINAGNSGFTILSISAKVKRLSEISEIFLISGRAIDVTAYRINEIVQTEVYDKLQASTTIMEQLVKDFAKPIVKIDENTIVSESLNYMIKCNSDVLYISNSNGNIIGIITDKDIRRRIVGRDDTNNKPIKVFMSSPTISVKEGDTLKDALLKMQRYDINHLLIRGADSTPIGAIKESDITFIQNNSADFLTSSLQRASTIEEIKKCYARLPIFVNALVIGGARTTAITKSITSVSDIITRKLIELAIKKLGQPPVSYAFIALGSEGRMEQTLFTDQDNAIIYSDVEGIEKGASASYFNQFGTMICDMLNEIGYNYCDGGIMAKNPIWNASITTWRKYFTDWITTPEPQNIVEALIFFDYRVVYGDTTLGDTLRHTINKLVSANPSFLGQLARAGASYKTPLNFFGKIQTESVDNKSHSITIKNPIRVIVHLLRVYVLKENLEETNSLLRLNSLYDRGIISPSLYHDMLYALDFMMVLQFKAQMKAIMSGEPPTNLINLDELSTIEVNTLKNIFNQISIFQSKLKFDFGVRD